SKHLVSYDGVNAEVDAELGHVLLLKASALLTEGGTGVFVTTASFMLNRNTKSAYALLGRIGLSVDAVLSLPPGTFGSWMTIPCLLVVIRRQPAIRLFVGELSP